MKSGGELQEISSRNYCEEITTNRHEFIGSHASIVKNPLNNSINKVKLCEASSHFQQDAHQFTIHLFPITPFSPKILRSLHGESFSLQINEEAL
jgi:hypothetical protein